MEISVAFIARAVLLFTPILLFIIYNRYKHAKYAKKVNNIPGPPTIPFLGNGIELLRRSPIDIFNNFYPGMAKFGPILRFWIADIAVVALHKATCIEPILHGMTHHVKSDNYKLFSEWFGLGLLTSRDEMWKTHRKILTPAFHFNILHEFLPIFNKNAYNLTKKLEKEPNAKAKEGFNIFPHSSLCSLDIICESSMGCKIDAQEGKNLDYVNAINIMNEILTKRYFIFYLRSNFIFKLLPIRREFDNALSIINNFTDKVINERRTYLESINFSSENLQANSSDGTRRRLAFLDLLLTAQAQGSDFMSQKDIRDQVSTFMFEGHDTVSTSTCWVLFLMGTYPDIQEKVVQELNEVFGDSGRAPDMNDLANLKYLERCIKETLRLFPSVPFFERKIEQDVEIDYKHYIPSGTTATVNVYMLHRDHDYWPNPEKFDPDRFLPENSQGRYPYAYVPFSAGPRNCIGRKFALLEEKTVVSTVLRRFRVEAAHEVKDAQLQAGIVLRPKNGLSIRLYDRDTHPKLRMNATAEN